MTNCKRPHTSVLPTLKNVSMNDYQSAHIKGHLLNNSLGGIGLPSNLFPITCNHAHDRFLDVEINRDISSGTFIKTWVSAGISTPVTSADIDWLNENTPPSLRFDNR